MSDNYNGDDDRLSYAYDHDESSHAVTPGPWLSGLTIAYLVLLSLLLYPLTILVRKLRKHRSLKSASARRKILHPANDSDEPSYEEDGVSDQPKRRAGTETNRTTPGTESPADSPSSGCNGRKSGASDNDYRPPTLSSPPPYPPPDSSSSRDKDEANNGHVPSVIALEMAKLDQFLVELEDDDDGDLVNLGGTSPSENKSISYAALERTEKSAPRKHKRRPSLGDAVANIPKLVKSRSKELIRSRSTRSDGCDVDNSKNGDADGKSVASVASRSSRLVRRVAGRIIRPIHRRRGRRIVVMPSPGTCSSNDNGYMYANDPINPKGRTMDSSTNIVHAGGNASHIVGCRNFVARGGTRRKGYIVAHFVAESSQLYATKKSPVESDKAIISPKGGEINARPDGEKNASSSQDPMLVSEAIVVGEDSRVAKDDDEPCKGDQVPSSLYISYSEDTNRDNAIVGSDEMVNHGAFDDYNWKDLPYDIRNAATLLGYCETSWDEGQELAITRKKWDELASDEMAAAAKLGYNDQFWNRPRRWDQEAETLDASRINDAIRRQDTLREVLRHDEESQKIAKIAIPTTVETMIGTILTAIELAVISKYLGSDALAVFGIVDLATSVTEIIGTGIGAAEEAMVAQSIGSGDYYRAGSIVQLSIWLYILLAIPAYTLWIVFIENFALYFDLGEDVAELAKSYIPIISLHHFIEDIFSDTLGRLMRIDGKDWQMCIIDSVFSFFHVIGIVVGIGCFDFGLVGVAWIEVVSSVMYGLFMYSFCACMGWLKPFQRGLFDMKAIRNGTLMKELVRCAVPLCISELLGSGEWHILTLYAAYIGDVAAWTVAGAIWELFEQSSEGIGLAAVIRIGYHLGQANPTMAKISAYKSLVACLIWSATLTTIFLCQSNSIIAMFTDDEHITGVLENAVVLIGAGNCVMSIGNLAWTILSAQSRPKITFWVYGGLVVARVCVPLASIFTFKLNYDITGLVAAIVISYATSTAILLIFIFISNWTKICCRIISAHSEHSFVALLAVDEENGKQTWQPSKEEQPSEETTFALKNELDLV